MEFEKKSLDVLFTHLSRLKPPPTQTNDSFSHQLSESEEGGCQCFFSFQCLGFNCQTTYD